MGYVSGDISDISGFPCYTVYYCILLTGDYYGGEYFVLPRTSSGVNTCAARDFIFHMDRNVRGNFLPSDWSHDRDA